jgi:hypothetical protein
MNDLERFHACMSYEKMDRVPTWIWGPWPETEELWLKDGYNPKEFDLYEGFDRWNVIDDCFFPNPPFEKKVINEDDKHILYMNHEGILIREMKQNPYSSMPQFVRFPVETRQEFRQFWSERMAIDLDKRFGRGWQQNLQEIQKKTNPFIVIGDRWSGFFGPLRNLMGVENLCKTFYDDSAFIEEMMDAEVDLIIGILGQVLDVVSIDAFVMWEDMAYKTSPLISPAMVRKYMLPRYKKVTEYLYGRGVKYIGLDSDGQIGPLIPIWIEAGLNFLYPFEVQAGMDVIQIRKQYGKDLRIWGGLDKRALAEGPQAIDNEITRLMPLMSQGGYIPFTDHSIPPDVTFENYLYFRKQFKMALEKAVN